MLLLIAKKLLHISLFIRIYDMVFSLVIEGNTLFLGDFFGMEHTLVSWQGFPLKILSWSS